MKPRIRKDRLLLLANVLEALDGYISPRFHMGHWTGGPAGTESLTAIDAATTPKKLTECATSACAAGYAATIPAFRKEGFVLDDGRPFYKGAIGFEACGAFFGLNDRQTQRLFGGNDFRDLDEEVRVIRTFVARAA